MSYFTNQEKKTVWWYDNDANAPGGLVKIDEAVAMAIAQPAPTAEQVLDAACAERDARLAATDWYAVRASEPGGKPIPENVLAYRAALRAIDQQPGWPSDVTWPELPASLAS